MKNTKKITLCCQILLAAILFFQTIKANSGLIPIGYIQFAYIEEENNPPIINPLGNGSFSIPASAVVYDDRAVIITFFCSYGSADAELCDGDIVVGTWHKPSGTQTMTIRLTIIPGDYTIYLYLQNGTTLYGEYTLD